VSGMLHLPTAALAIGLAVGALLLGRPRPRPLGTALIVALLAVVGLGAIVAVTVPGGSVGLSYYAEKLLWHAVVLALPAAVVAVGWLLAGAYRSSLASRMSGDRPVLRAALVLMPAMLLLAYAGGWLSHGLQANLRGLAGPAGVSPQVPLVVLGYEGADRLAGRPVLPYLIHPQGWQLWLRYPDAHAAQVARTLGAEVPDLLVLSTHRARPICEWLSRHPDAVRLTGPRLGHVDLIDRGCPEEVVRPELWEVLVTPAEWWQDTRWAGTGGAPDPSVITPEVLVDRADGASPTG